MCAVMEDGGIALIRVKGRGNFGNAMPLKRFINHFQGMKEEQKYVIDLHECETMDSTFMGVIAGVCITTVQRGKGCVVVVNVNDQCKRLLTNLGLTYMLEMRSGGSKTMERGAAQLEPVESGEVSKLEQVCLTLEAHKDLIKIDEQNEVRFQGVIEYLQKSLDEEKGSCS